MSKYFKMFPNQPQMANASHTVLKPQVAANHSMGVWGLPGTFPTHIVRTWIISNHKHLKSVWPRSKVNDFYYAYKKLIDRGHAPWPEGIKSEDLNAATGYTDSLMWFSAIKTLIDETKIEPKWLMGTGAAPDPTQIISNISEGGLKVAKNLKWAGILVIAGVSIYFLYPWLTAARKVKKTKNKVS